MMARLVPLFLLTVALIGCLPEPLPIALEQAETRLVIASQVVPGEIMIVTVSKSFGALTFSEEDGDPGDELLDQVLVESAEVTVSYDGIVDTLFAVEGLPGFYFSVETPQILNTTYRLDVFDPETGLVVSADAEMLEFVPLDAVTATFESTDFFDETTLNYTFTDPAGVSNWYMLNVFELDDLDGSGNMIFSTTGSAVSTTLITDQSFNTSEISGSIELFEFDDDSLVVSFSNISEEYFDYLTLREQGGDLLTSLLNEPINYPSNVRNGYGYFLTHYPDVQVVAVGE